jgi:hypothetical protein
LVTWVFYLLLSANSLTNPSLVSAASQPIFNVKEDFLEPELERLGYIGHCNNLFGSGSIEFASSRIGAQVSLSPQTS